MVQTHSELFNFIEKCNCVTSLCAVTAETEPKSSRVASDGFVEFANFVETTI